MTDKPAAPNPSVFRPYPYPTPNAPRSALQELLLAWVLTYGNGSSERRISGDGAGYTLNPWPLFWGGFLDVRQDLRRLTKEFRINQAGLDILKEDL